MGYSSSGSTPKNRLFGSEILNNTGVTTGEHLPLHLWPAVFSSWFVLLSDLSSSTDIYVDSFLLSCRGGKSGIS